MITTDIEKKLPDTLDKRGYRSLVWKFLATWLSCVFVLVAIAFLANLDWAREPIEGALSEAFHRHVELGKLSWNFGFNGLAVATDRMSVNEPDGKPFLLTGHSEIGIAFTRLFRGEILIKYLTFKQPELWAVKLTKNTWNFSDLLQPGPDIRFIELDQGRLHLIDRCTTCTQSTPGAPGAPGFSPYDFQNINLKLIFPRKDRRWPFYLSFTLPRKGYTTSVKFTALGAGLLDNWQSNPYKFEVDADELNPRDLGPLSSLLPQVDGLFKLKVSGDGMLEKGLRGNATATIRNFSLMAPTLGPIKAPSASGEATFTVNTKKLAWTSLVLDLGSLQIRSHGNFSNWQHNPDYTAAIKGKVSDLTQLNHLLPAAEAAAQSRGNSPEIWQMLEGGNLSGDAEFDLAVESRSGQQSYSTRIKTAGMTAHQLVKRWPSTWLNAVAQAPTSQVRGELKILPNGDLDFPDVNLIAGNSKLHVSGTSNKDGTQCQFKFSGQGLSLKDLSDRVMGNPELSRQIEKVLAIGSASRLKVGGAVDISGQYQRDEKAHHLDLTAHLNNAEIALKDGGYDSHKLQGDITYDGKYLKFANVSGTLGDGPFTLNGTVRLDSNPVCDIDLNLPIELSELGAAMKILKVQLPILSELQLHGRVRDFSMSIKGTTRSPDIELTAVPEDLYYQPPGMSRPLRSVSGNIDYQKDTLTLKEVGLVGQNSKLITSLVIDKLSGDSTLTRLKVRTSGSDLSDVHYYLQSPLMPPALRQDYLDFLQRYKLLSFHGRVYGDVTWQSNGKEPFAFDGVIGFYNVGGRFGEKGYPLDHAGGVIAISGPELLLQDVSGAVGRTKFNLDGHINEYRSPAVVGTLNLSTEVFPDELLKLLPGLADQWQGKILSSGPLTVRASVLAKQGASMVIFSGRADGKDNLRLTTPFGTIFQPAGVPITLDGSAMVNPGPAGSVEIKDSHLLVGDSVLQAHGRYAWVADTKVPPTVEATITSPNPVAAKTLVSILDPATKADLVHGTITGTITAKGPVDALTTQGFLAFDNLKLPQYNLSQVTGRVESPGWSLPAPNQTGVIARSDSKIKLHLDSVANGELVAHDIDALVEFQSPKNGMTTPRVALSAGTAKVAAGKLDLSGWLDLTNHKVHAEFTLSGVDSNQVLSEMAGYANEISGAATAHFVLDSEGLEYKDLLHNLDGHGHVTISDGKVSRFGQLQSKLTQANLLHQGLFGFNLNNLLQSMVPVRTGIFKDLHASFLITDGILSVNDLKYNGDDMRLWGGGLVNLPLNTITLEVSGKVPRVSSSLLTGPMGEVSKRMTFQNFMYTVTLHKLENLPPVPLLGDIASDKPRVFSFAIIAPLDRPNSVATSIEKSFHWLPSLPNASAHPIPSTELR